jgi:hypothetical protein
MHSAGKLHPEWGYVAPAPGFMHTARIALVATVIGAIGGAVVIVSLVERPGSNDDHASIAGHALVTSAPVTPNPAGSSQGGNAYSGPRTCAARYGKRPIVGACCCVDVDPERYREYAETERSNVVASESANTCQRSFIGQNSYDSRSDSGSSRQSGGDRA